MEPQDTPLRHRLDRLVSGLTLLESRRSAEQVAQAVSYSVVHSRRLFQRAFGESPAAFARRICLERAAEDLATTDLSVWQVGLRAGYAGTEPFARAFRRAFRLNPSRFRDLRTSHRADGPSTWLWAPNPLHYWRGCLIATMRQEPTQMNLTQRLIDHDLGLTTAILEKARTLSDTQLDAPFPEAMRLLVFEEPETCLRDVLDRMVLTKEVWLNAFLGREWDMSRETTLAAIIARWQAVKPEFASFVATLEEDGRWNDSFVDALCTPSETFSFGGVIAHILTFSAVRRSVALRELRRHGADGLGYGDPLEWGSTPTLAATC